MPNNNEEAAIGSGAAASTSTHNGKNNAKLEGAGRSTGISVSENKISGLNADRGGGSTSNLPAPNSSNSVLSTNVVIMNHDNLPHGENVSTVALSGGNIPNFPQSRGVNPTSSSNAVSGSLRLRNLRLNTPPLLLETPAPTYFSPRSSWLNTSPLITATGHTESNARRLDQAIDVISSTNIGRELLNTVSTVANFRGLHVTLIGNGSSMAVMPSNSANASNGVGCGSHLHCYFASLDNLSTGLDNVTQERRDAVRLFHELVHVYNNLVGERLVVIGQAEGQRTASLDYEEAAVMGVRGLEGYFSENRFRQELGLPVRAIYGAGENTIHRNGTIQYGLSPAVPLVPHPGGGSKGGRSR